MKKLLIFAMVLLMVGISQAQFEGFLWGKQRNTKIVWGDTFQATDSLHLKTTATYISDSTDATLYTNMIFIDNRTQGTGVLTFSADSVDSPMDSAATLYFRYYDDKDVHAVQYWDVWHQIGAYLKTDTLYVFQLADSSWWRPARGFQTKVVKFDADDDSATVNMGFYNN